MSQELDNLSRGLAAGRLSRREFLGRATALGVSAAFANSLLAGAAMAQTPKKGGILKAGLVGGAATDTLDPAKFIELMSYFGKCWGEFLVALKADGGLENRLAEEIGSSKDAKVWTFKVRKDVEFHNGKTVTAEDVVATLQRHSSKESQSGALGILAGIENIRADGRDVIVTVKEPNAEFPYLMADYHLVIQPNGGKDDPAEGISAGPYRMTVNQPGVRHGGERFANFWQADKMGFADQVEILVINDTTARVSALQGGQVHMINKVETKVVDLIKHLPSLKIEALSGPGHYCFNMFCDTAPFNSNDFRMALKLAVDRQEMVDKILRGYGTVGNDFPINAAYPLFPEGIEQRFFDPDKAKFHYRKSGHSGSILLRASDVAFAGAVDAAQLFQQSAAKAGITVEVKREPGDGYWSGVWNKQPFCAANWRGRATQGWMYSTTYRSTAPWNDTHFFNERFDKLLTEATGELDQDKRKNLYREMALLVRDEGGTIVPMFNQFIDAISDQVGGYVGRVDSLMNGYALTQCWLEA
ncbi:MULTISPECIES: ABC transporter substrate-binding protein [unclassified Mesorhizobium]|uniref:ABC transporter substrate-binding protein n=1 Tax=unclassified Mesorhizobium TaxID=325217 RepID=UPI000FE8D024|nr:MULTISPECIES: ABC transporter substrate-binding protein [unclassified Mesorhizobium]RWE82305.1 MAG: ABC transporter substrate-binding protein [Mesorhizobium sp.]TGQ85799.1 ABC transporter substrate-binding protein [Mesorhizobium sp. M8A.F.Ca.ET.208.01.1.1]TGT47684.1 ABC transporter substrate-binding protein [Mesorhizobium sp. M8A.F.Ca.ET.167.01.1.1]TIR03031.1 MAG: ABC transporter substrate-binding protein [Mesorhizobium sp.]